MTNQLTCTKCLGSSFALCKLCATSTCFPHFQQWVSQVPCKHIAMFTTQLTEVEAAECKEYLEAAKLLKSIDQRIDQWIAKLFHQIDSHVLQFAEELGEHLDIFKAAQAHKLKISVSKLTIEDCKNGLPGVEAKLPAASVQDFERYLGKILTQETEASLASDLSQSIKICENDVEEALECSLLSTSKVHSCEVYGILHDEYDSMNLSWDTSGSCYKWQSIFLSSASKFPVDKVSACEWFEDNSKVAIGKLGGDVVITDRNGDCKTLGVQLFGGITRLAHLSRSNQLMTLNHGQRIAMWCLDRGKFIYLKPEYSVTDFHVSQSYIALTRLRKAIVRDLISDETIFSFDCPADSTIVSVSDDQNQLMVGCKSGYLKHFDLRTGLPFQAVKPSARSAVQLRMTESYNTMACLFSNLTMQVLETSNMLPVKYWRPESEASAVEWLGGSLVTGTKAGEIRISC